MPRGGSGHRWLGTYLIWVMHLIPPFALTSATLQTRRPNPLSCCTARSSEPASPFDRTQKSHFENYTTIIHSMRRSAGAKLASAILFWWVVAGRASGQGLLADQASATPSEFATQASLIPDFGSVAQSFTPSLSQVGFVQLQTAIVPASLSSVTLIVNLRSGAYNGPIIGPHDSGGSGKQRK